MDHRVAEQKQAYGKAAEFLEAELIEWLGRMTPEKARAIFEQIDCLWEEGGRR